MSNKITYDNVEYGTTDGRIQFGHLHDDPSKGSSVISDVMLQASDPLHYMMMDKNGNRPGWTSQRAPGVFQVKCGDNRKPDEPALVLHALNGDILIKAENGRVRIQGLDVDILAKGGNNKRGVIDIKSNESINIESKNVNIKGKASAKFITSGMGEIVCNTSLKMYAGFSQCVSAASAKTGKTAKGSEGLPSINGLDTKQVVQKRTDALE